MFSLFHRSSLRTLPSQHLINNTAKPVLPLSPGEASVEKDLPRSCSMPIKLMFQLLFKSQSQPAGTTQRHTGVGLRYSANQPTQLTTKILPEMTVINRGNLLLKRAISTVRIRIMASHFFPLPEILMPIWNEQHFIIFAFPIPGICSLSNKTERGGGGRVTLYRNTS